MSETLIDRAVDRSNMKISAEVAIQINKMNKWYGTFHVQPDGAPGLANRHRRALRLGKIDPDPLHQPA